MNYSKELFPFPHRKGNKWELVNKGDTSKPLREIIVCDAIIKYLPLKYNKITLTLNSKDYENFELYQTMFKQDLEVEPFLKTESIALKLSDEMKEKTKLLKIGSSLKVAVEFKGVWKILDKKYASWELIDYKEVLVKRGHFDEDGKYILSD